MAFKEIGRYRSEDFDFEADASIGNSGVTGVVKVQYYLEYVVKHQFSSNGLSEFIGETYLNITSVTSPINLYVGRGTHFLMSINSLSQGKTDYLGTSTSTNRGYELVSGQTYSNILICSIKNNPVPHNFIDGKFPLEVYASGYLTFSVVTTNGGIGRLTSGGGLRYINSKDFGSDVVPIQDKSTKIVLADNFTDENKNPNVSYSIFFGSSTPMASTEYEARRSLSSVYPDYTAYIYEYITVQIGLSLDGETLDIPYQDAPVDGNFTFDLTEDQLETLRIKAQGSDTVPIYYMVKTTRRLIRSGSTTISQEFYSKAERFFTIVGCNPTLNPTVVDVNSDTIALTGNPNVFVRYESMAEYAINAAASKHATIVSQSVTCGSKTVTNLPYGVIDNVESGTFHFYVTDSRNMGASSSVFKELIEYVKPTCYQKAEIEITGETGATIKLKVNGSYFNGSFGAANNTFKLEVRMTDGNDNWGQWTTFPATPTFNGTTYELETTFGGLNYGKAYIFQTRITDKLNIVESAQYVARMLPVFDWGEEDFNFNVPINIEADNLDMHGETIIRHSTSTNNTVLSASGGNIYIRPDGTNSTYGQTILYGSGNVSVSGDITVSGGATFSDSVSFGSSFTIEGNNLADYVIATGEEAMGSNGTWYWRKWASGKAEAWGCRNFGNMAVTTTWGNLYRSAIFTQDLPNNVFIRTPDAININIVHSGYGGWICKHEQTAPSADTTGSFIFVRPASATVSPTNIGFHIIGEWR